MSMSVYIKVVDVIKVLLIISWLFLSLSAANHVCYIKPHCTQGGKASCCYTWSVHNFKMLANSDTILYVSPGTYNLNSSIQISAVKNLTVFGNDSTFVCLENKSNFCISVVNSSSIHIANMKFTGCGCQIEHCIDLSNSAVVYLLDTSSVNMTSVAFQNICGYGIMGINIASNSILKNIIIYQNRANFSCHHQQQLMTGGIMWLYNKIVTSNSAKLSISDLIIHNITNNGKFLYSGVNLSAINLLLHHQKCHVNISNTVIADVTSTNVPLVFISILSISTPFINIKNISYHNSNVYSVLKVVSARESSVTLHVNNQTFYNNTVCEYLVSFSNVTPLFKGSTLFENNKANIILRFNKYITLYKKAVVSFSYNRPSPFKQTFHRFIIERWDEASKECPFQLSSKNKLVYTSIKFCNNIGYFREVYVHSFLRNCIWNSTNMTGEYSPDLETLYKYIIRTCDNETRTIKFGKENDICQCGLRSNCLVYEPLSQVYPGQSVTINVNHSKSSYNLLVQTEIENNPFEDIAPTCEVLPTCNTVYHQCTILSYTVEFNATSGSKCLILLRTAKRLLYVLDITTGNCPLGFSLDFDGICNCDPKLQNKLEGIICNITNEKFKPPPNSWISFTSNEIIYVTYCRYGYCLQISGFISLHTSDDQCLPSRSGISCGQCKNGLSTTLGSKVCKRCSNNGLFFIVLFAVAGIILVLSLFVLNLTVANGDIYGFIVFVNALSVVRSERFAATSYVIVALGNLDWGIETCFYDGMTAYAATWLQFIFPVYLLLIVAGIVIASRYSTKIEKLTRTKVIPVIATLLLLPYTKVMIIIFSGLFSYTTIHHLNSRKTEIYWAVDTSVPLFGPRHLLLFTFCTILLLCVIIPINVLLLFTKSFYRFKFVAKYLKPFLDAYQAPFRDECRYLLGLELLLRLLVYMVNHLLVRQASAIYIIITLLYTAYICWLKPFRDHWKMFSSLLYILYLGIITTLFLQYTMTEIESNKTFRVILGMVVSAGFVEFLIIVAYHVWKNVFCHFKYIKKHFQKLELKHFGFISHKTLAQSQDTATESQESSGNYHEYRDELLMLD